ncbi:MAG: hypothetical protein WCD31_10295 [Gillisia sp.]
MATAHFTNLPVYLKALEVFKISRAISYCVGDSENILRLGHSNNRNSRFAQDIVMDSLALAPQLALLQNTDSPSRRLSHIKKIKKAAKNILFKCRKLEIQNLKEREFLVILTAEIQQFEKLFSEWLDGLQLQKGLH